jgi:hypothetical protein
MPLTKFQSTIVRLLAKNRSPDSHLAGGAALNFSPNSKRYSHDLDYFHDSVESLAEVFAKDCELLKQNKFSVSVEIKLPGYIRAIVSNGDGSTKIEWAHDSAWRFMPVVIDPDSGYQLHPIDLAINKLLALAGRDEARDFLDILEIDRSMLSLGALCWAAVGKDPGFTPIALLELLKRRGRYRKEDFARLHLTSEVNLEEMKQQWLEALEKAEVFISRRPAKEVGCLYYSKSKKNFVTPELALVVGADADTVMHFGKLGGVLPLIAGESTC